MGKAGKWLRSFLMGKKEKEKCQSNVSCYSVGSENPGTPLSTIPKEKRRWSFRRSSAMAASPKDSTHMDSMTTAMAQIRFEAENEQKRHDLTAAAAEAAVEAAVAAAQVASAVIRLTSGNGKASLIQEVAATKIQSFFRSYLARKALRALRGLVKLQALARGHLVRKQATATLRCMQALFTAQARARANRIQMAEDPKPGNQRPSVHRKSTQDDLFRPAYDEIDGSIEENIKIVEMDIGEPNRSSKGRNSYSKMSQIEGANHRFSTQNAYMNKESYNFSPDPSALTDMSPRACSGHFEDYSFDTAQTSAHYYSTVSKPDPSKAPFGFPRSEYAESESYDYPFFPNYMANTESSRAKVRSQSAPKTRPDSLERQPSRRKRSVEGRNIPRAVRMQRSSSQVSSVAQNYQYPWAIKLNKSAVSECGSTRSAVTNLNYSRSIVTNEVPGNTY